MTSLGTLLYTWLFGIEVGCDAYGNRYYHNKVAPDHKRYKRWVIYSGVEEASKIPADWHAWIHYVIDEVPEKAIPKHKKWEKQHIPNLSGTDYAYRPPGHFLEGGKRDAARGDYEPWQPK